MEDDPVSATPVGVASPLSAKRTNEESNGISLVSRDPKKSKVPESTFSSTGDHDPSPTTIATPNLVGRSVSASPGGRSVTSVSPGGPLDERASARKERQRNQEEKRRKEAAAAAIRAEDEARKAAIQSAKKKEKRERLEAERRRQEEEARKAKKAKEAALAKSKADTKAAKKVHQAAQTNTAEARKLFEKGLKKLAEEVDKCEKEALKADKALAEADPAAAAQAAKRAALEVEQMHELQRQSVLATAAAHFAPWPGALALPEEAAGWGTGELLRLYDTCTSFAKPLNLTPFGLEDLMAALCHTKCEVVLVTSIGMALLNAVLAPPVKSKAHEKQSLSSLAAGGGERGAASSSSHRFKVRLLDEPIDLGPNLEGAQSGEEEGEEEEFNYFGGRVPPPDSITKLTWQYVMLYTLRRSKAAQSLLDATPFRTGSAAANSALSPNSEQKTASSTTGGGGTLWDDHVARAASLRAGLRALRRRELHELPCEQKLALLGALGLMGYESGAIALAMEERLERRAEVERDRKETDKEERDREREGRASLREDAIAQLREEKAEKEAAEAEAKEEKDGKAGKDKQGTLDAFLGKDKSGGRSKSKLGKSGGSSASISSLVSQVSSDSAKGGSQVSKKSGSAKGKKGKAVKDESMELDAESLDGDAEDAGKKKEGKKKEWTPSHFAIKAKMDQLEEAELLGDARILGLDELHLASLEAKQADQPLKGEAKGEAEKEGNKGPSVDAEEAAMLQELEASEAALLAAENDEEEDEAMLLHKLSRTQMLQHRKDREDLVRQARLNLEDAREAFALREKRKLGLGQIQQTLREYEERKLPVPKAVCDALLKQARAAKLEGEDFKAKGGWMVKDVAALYKKRALAKEEEAKAKQARRWEDQLGSLLVRREPLATLRTAAPGQALEAWLNPTAAKEAHSGAHAGAGGQTTTVSLWGFGKGERPVGGRPKDWDDRRQRLWAMLHTPLAAPFRAALPPSSGDSLAPPPALLTVRWTCVESVSALRALYNAVPSQGDAGLSGLRARLQAEYGDAVLLDEDEEDGDEEDTEWDVDHAWVGKRLKREIEVEQSSSKKGGGGGAANSVSKVTTLGTVVGWLSALKNEGQALWHVALDHQKMEEDLEEFEVVDALKAYDESDEKKRKEEADKAKAEQAAMDEDKAEGEEEEEDKPWRKYVNNRVPKEERITSEDEVGLGALRQALLETEQQSLAGIKEKERERDKASRSAGAGKEAALAAAPWCLGRDQHARLSWRDAVKGASSRPELTDLLLTFEQVLRGLQAAEDVDDGTDKIRRREKEGWQFGVGISIGGHSDPEDLDKGSEAPPAAANSSEVSSEERAPKQPHEWVGRFVRRFDAGFPGGKGDGKVVAYLPPSPAAIKEGGLAEGGEDEPALWFVQYVWGAGDEPDEEDLDEAEMLAAIKAYDEDEDEAEMEAEAEDDEEEEEGDDADDLEDSEDEEEEEEEEDDEEEPRLWPTLNSREEWQRAVRGAKTAGQVAMALAALEDAATKFKVLEPKAFGGPAAGRRKSRGASSRFMAMPITSRRAAAVKATAGIAKNARDERAREDSIFGGKAGKRSGGSGRGAAKGRKGQRSPAKRASGRRR